MRRVVRLYPKRWRERYGDEVSDLLARSEHPRRDHVNVVVHAVIAWMELPVVSVVLVIAAMASLLQFGYTLGQLSNGLDEVHRHWWSTSSALLAVVTVAAAVTSARLARRRVDT
jgi:hypothetical protein